MREQDQPAPHEAPAEEQTRSAPDSIPRAAGHLWHSLVQLGESLRDYGRSRLHAITDGIQAQVKDTVRVLVGMVVAAVLSIVGLIMTGLTIIIAFWDSPHRLLAAVLTTVGFFLFAFVIALVIRQKLKKQAVLLRTSAQAALLIAAARRMMR